MGESAIYTVAMKIALNGAGDPILPLIAAYKERAVDLAVEEEAAHPLRMVEANWRRLLKVLVPLVDDMQAVERAFDAPDDDALMEHLRAAVYQAAELFDCYSQLLPDRIKTTSASEKKAVKEFKEKARRMRSATAHLCNRCKHEGVVLQLLWCRSLSDGRIGARFLVQKYVGHDTLLRDDQIHKGKKCGIGVAKFIIEMMHNLLRVDLAAAKLLSGVSPCEPRSLTVDPAVAGAGASLRQLGDIEPTLFDEPEFIDGFLIEGDSLALIKVRGHDLGPINVRAKLDLHGVSKFGMM